MQKYCIRLLSLAAFLLVWHLVTEFKLVLLPTPLETIEAFIRLNVVGDPFYNRTIYELTLSSLWIVTKGALAGFLLAIPLGLFMGRIGILETALSTLVELFRPIPPLAWIPVAYLIFERFPSPTEYVQVFVVFVGVFFPVLINTIDGVKSTNLIYLNVAQIFGASQLQTVVKVIIPSVLPFVSTSIRVGVGIGWMCVVAAEFVGGRMGIGYYIWSSYNLGGRNAEIIAGFIAIGVVGYLLNQGLLWLERRLIPWRYL